MGEKKSIEELEAMFKSLAMLTAVPKEAINPLMVIDAPPLELSDSETRIEPEKVICNKFAFAIPVTDVPKTLFAMDFASEPSKENCTLIIECKPTIGKPKNLKYPNKKRKRRIWKKWAKRFGTTPGKRLYLPNVEVGCKFANEQNNYPYWRVKAKPITQE